jgi:hypothetical protein
MTQGFRAAQNYMRRGGCRTAPPSLGTRVVGRLRAARARTIALGFALATFIFQPIKVALRKAK